MIMPGAAGLSVIHAMSFGLPVITSNKQEHAPEIEAINPSITGDFFRDGFADDLAKKIKVWKDRMNRNRHFHRSSCLEMVKNFYMPDLVSNKMLNFFKEINEK